MPPEITAKYYDLGPFEASYFPRLFMHYVVHVGVCHHYGDASARDIDTAMKLGAGYPMGPLELADFTGLDNKKAILAVMLQKTGDCVFRPIPVLDRLVSDGKLGRKSGEGIYKYD